MKRKNLYLLCGPAGVGKTTWVKDNIKDDTKDIHISRDLIRFSMVSENEDYFSKENEVFNEFIRQIKEGIDSYENIFVDATHINQASRNKVLKNLPLDKINIIPVNFIIPLDVCLKRNAQRTGRAKVPETAIKNMYKNFSPASLDENPLYTEIWNIKEKNLDRS